ncbi:cardiolipin synthase [Sulfuricaulis sp.]|jgi:cardiolipin synthase|uniref:cardiolipin synthase n=1 Tax=Sulfuricaulis sp. TaxID=2003553 RepID=UPI00355A6E9B
MAVAACCLHILAGCASLPDAAREMEVPHAQAVEFGNARGPVSASKSAAILEELKSKSGDIDILQKHLALEQAINADSPLVLGNKLVLLQDGPATYQAMFAAMRKAKDHINLETYIFEDDDIGKQFADLLLERQAAGVQVNLIYDSVGCLNTPKVFFERLSAVGIQVIEFNPINPLAGNKKEWLLNNRDHRKLLVVDGRIAFIGGINISESYSSDPSSKSARKKGVNTVGWRDTHLQIEGPVVAEFQKLFMNTWSKQKGQPLTQKNYFPKLNKQGDDIVRAIGSASADPHSLIYLTLLSAIANAEQRVYLTNAYFVPDPQLLKSLTDAARRGVDVRLVLPSYSDSWTVFHAGRSHYTKLLRAGVKIYERRGAVMHSKTASIDNVWSTIGSTNLDWRSFLHNDEINATILGRDFSRQMDAMFAKDLTESDAIDLDRWKDRSLILRLKEWLARLAEYWL